MLFFFIIYYFLEKGKTINKKEKFYKYHKYFFEDFKLMDFISLIDGVVISNADVDLHDYEKEGRLDLNLSLSALVSKHDKISQIVNFIKCVKFMIDDSVFIDIQDYDKNERIDLNFSISAIVNEEKNLNQIVKFVKSAKLKNSDIILANDSDKLVIESEIEDIELKNTEDFEISINDISVRLSLKKSENGSLSLSSIYLKELTVDIHQKLIDNLIQSLKSDMEKNGVFNIKVILSSGRIILKGDYKKSFFNIPTTIPFSVEFSVDSKKSLVKIEIEKIHLLKSLNVPEFIIQNIVMEAIKDNLKYDFVKTYKNYCLVNLRRLIPEFVDYNTIDVSIADGSIVLNISEKNNPVENNIVENVNESQKTVDVNEHEQANLSDISELENTNSKDNKDNNDDKNDEE